MDYKEKLEEAKRLYELANADQKYVLESFFPELKESKDEKVRMALVEMVHDTTGDELWVDYNVHKEEVLAWLEKQGEQKPTIEMKSAEESLGIDSETYNEIVNDCIFGENKPKFKVGDWVVYYRNDSSREVIQVYDIRDGRYYFTDNVHFSWSVKECDKRCHLWTIQDAKDGNVLYCENSGIEYIVMNKGINKCNNIDSYFEYNSEDGFDIGVPSVLSAEEDIITPATKEQRDLLFQKMKEAGYKWVADKKELKKISQRMISAEAKEAMYDKPACAWGEDDEKMLVDAYVMLDWYKGNNWWTARRIKDWLKSLKERCTWKPSDEQMETLKYACGGNYVDLGVLDSLYNDLKKLKGE